MTPSGGRHRRRRFRLVVTALLGLAVLATLGAGVVWHFGHGGSWQVVATPSMGTVAPVGTLVLTEPASTVAVGDVVTYRPPVANHPLDVTHRVVAVDPDGGFRTRGDINGSEDPWTAHPRDLVGVVVAILPGLGWLVRGTQLLVVGTVLVYVVSRLLPWRWGLPLRVLGFSLVVTTAVSILRPFVGAILLGTTADGADTHVTVVSTGLLPIRATAATGGQVDLVDGQVGLITTQLPPEAKGAVVTTGVHMPFWMWVVMTAIWLIPMFYGLLMAWRRPVEDPPGPTRPVPWRPADQPTDELPAVGARWALTRFDPLIAVATGAVVALVCSSLVPPTSAAFTAQVVNTTNTAASAPFFTCANALSGLTTSDYLVWPLDDATVTSGSTARDVSGNTRPGTYTNAFTTTTNTPCARDTARAVTLAPTAAAPSFVATTGLVAVASSNVFSLAVWFRTTTATGGKLMGWGNLRTGQSVTYDRHLYMTDGGQVVFGVYPNAVRTVVSPKSYNDGQWHLAVATLSTAGMVLYLDGAQVAADTATTTAEGNLLNLGYWRVGWDNLAGWTSRPATDYWTGSLADAAVFTTALTATQVQQIYRTAS